MDIDLILESIFEEYKKKCIRFGRNEVKVNQHLESVREQIETNMKSSLDHLVGQPANTQTVATIRHVMNQNLNQFLDTEVTLDDIHMDGDTITVDMTYRPKFPASGIRVRGGVAASAVNPAHDIISHSL